MIIYVCYTINVKIIHKVYIHISLNVLCNSFFIDIDSYTFKHNTVLTLNEWHRVDISVQFRKILEFVVNLQVARTWGLEKSLVGQV